MKEEVDQLPFAWPRLLERLARSERLAKFIEPLHPEDTPTILKRLMRMMYLTDDASEKTAREWHESFRDHSKLKIMRRRDALAAVAFAVIVGVVASALVALAIAVSTDVKIGDAAAFGWMSAPALMMLIGTGLAFGLVLLLSDNDIERRSPLSAARVFIFVAFAGFSGAALFAIVDYAWWSAGIVGALGIWGALRLSIGAVRLPRSESFRRIVSQPTTAIPDHVIIALSLPIREPDEIKEAEITACADAFAQKIEQIALDNNFAEKEPRDAFTILLEGHATERFDSYQIDRSPWVHHLRAIVHQHWQGKKLPKLHVIASEETEKCRASFVRALKAVFAGHPAGVEGKILCDLTANYHDFNSVGQALANVLGGISGTVRIDATGGTSLFSMAITPQSLRDYGGIVSLFWFPKEGEPKDILLKAEQIETEAPGAARPA